MALKWELSFRAIPWPWLGAVHHNRMGWLITAWWHHWSVESQEQLCYFSCILNEFQEWLLSVISPQGKLSKTQCPNSGPVSVTTSTGFRSTEQKETTLNHKTPAVTSWSAVSSNAQQPGQCLSCYPVSVTRLKGKNQVPVSCFPFWTKPLSPCVRIKGLQAHRRAQVSSVLYF